MPREPQPLGRRPHAALDGRRLRRRLHPQRPAGHAGAHREVARRHRRRQARLVQRRPQRGLEARRRGARPGCRQGLPAGHGGAADRRRHGAVAAIGISAMLGHIAVVKGRGAACALGAHFAMDPGTMAIGSVALAWAAPSSTATRRPWPSRRSRCRSSAWRSTAPAGARARAPWRSSSSCLQRALKGSPGAVRPPRRHGSGGASGWTGTTERRRCMRVGLVTPYSWTVPGRRQPAHRASRRRARGARPRALDHRPRRRARRRPGAPWTAGASRRPPRRFIPMGTAFPIPSNGSRAYIS